MKPCPIVGKWSASFYITEVGWDHVAAGLCTSPKCVIAKKYIDQGSVVSTGTGSKKIAKTVPGYWGALA